MYKRQLQVCDGYLVATFATEVFRAVGGDIHLMPARTMSQAAEQMHRRLAGFFPCLQLFLNNPVHLIPQIFGNNRRTFSPAPFAFRFEFGAPSPGQTHGVEHIHALGAGFVQDAFNRSVPPDASLTATA